MATVYRAYDTRLEREVAIKVIRTSSFAPDVVEAMLVRFEREGKNLAKMMHSNIVPIHDYGEFEGSPYLVMAFIPGGTLKKQMDRRMDYRQAARLLAPVARALAYAHSLNVIHRDVKPANILITTAGDPMLSDFGVAKILEGEPGVTLTGTGVGIGTPEYMAPEQWENQVSPQSDIYALGVVLYELVTGRKPYTGDTPAAVLRRQLVEPLPRPKSFVPDLPDAVEQVLFKVLAKNPAERYTSMNELAAALEHLAAGAPALSLQPAVVDTRHEANPPAVVEPLPRPEPVKSVRPVQPGVSKIGDQTTELAAELYTGARRVGRSPEVPSIPAPAIKKTRRRIPWWGYVLGGLVILGLLGGACALGITFLTPKLPGLIAAHPAHTLTPTETQPPLATTPSLAATLTLELPTDTTVPPSSITAGATQTADKDGMVMVYIPAGSFLMGSDKSVDGQASDNELPQRTVSLDAYWIDRTDVTNAMFSAFVQATGYKTDAEQAGWGFTYHSSGNEDTMVGADWQHPQGPDSSLQGLEQYPVVQVNWNDAQTYCQWAGRRLPSEAEWEQAARGADGRIYPWGNQFPAGNLLNFADKNLAVSWADITIDDGFQFTSPAGNYPDGASPYGVLDMTGEVSQWVADWYDGTYYQYGPQVDPLGPSSGQYHVRRGGAWLDAASDVRSAKREYDAPDIRFDYVGFRCAVSS